MTVHITGKWPSYALEYNFDRRDGTCIRMSGIPLPVPHAPLSDEAIDSLRWHYEALHQQLFSAYMLWTADESEPTQSR